VEPSSRKTTSSTSSTLPSFPPDRCALLLFSSPGLIAPCSPAASSHAGFRRAASKPSSQCCPPEHLHWWVYSEPKPLLSLTGIARAETLVSPYGYCGHLFVLSIDMNPCPCVSMRAQCRNVSRTVCLDTSSSSSALSVALTGSTPSPFAYATLTTGESSSALTQIALSASNSSLRGRSSLPAIRCRS
jgi:hypothetical protein